MDIYFVSLGCDKNLVDSEMMITGLRKAGHRLVDDETAAEVIVVNTCCFIGDAKEESINALIEMGRYREEGRLKLLVAAGCLAQRYHTEIEEELPEVDIIIGTMGYESLAAAIEEKMQEKSGVLSYIESVDHLPEPLTDRDSMSGGYYAYLKIAEGCDKRCSYCIIPKVRGRYRSVPLDNLKMQAEHLVENGARELILVAQETTLYGVDLYGKKSLPELLEALSEIQDLKWLRILYCYPEEITDELIEAVRRLPKVCHYLDIPIQHGADTVLRRMGRHTSQREIADLIRRLRQEIPDIALRTTLITGFPGETEAEFEEMKAFVRRMEFDRLGVFAYSREEDTAAAEMPGQVPDEVKERRRDEIMAIQQEIAFARSESRVGQELEVMIEGRILEEGVTIARTYMDAPEVDGFVFLETEWDLMSGEFVKVKITGARGYDLLGEIIE